MTTDDITERLRADILSAVLAPGERLVELQLCERYACGRAAIRAALLELSTEGLVDRATNRGATVRRVTLDEAIEIHEARAALESLIAARAAARATDDDRSELLAIVDRMRTAVAEEKSAEYSELNSLLHRRIREMSGHSIASHLVGNLRDRAAHHSFRLATTPGRPTESLEQHAAIVDAVVAGQAEAAAEAMDKHLQSVIDALRRWGTVF